MKTNIYCGRTVAIITYATQSWDKRAINLNYQSINWIKELEYNAQVVHKFNLFSYYFLNDQQKDSGMNEFTKLTKQH